MKDRDIIKLFDRVCFDRTSMLADLAITSKCETYFRDILAKQLLSEADDALPFREFTNANYRRGDLAIICRKTKRPLAIFELKNYSHFDALQVNVDLRVNNANAIVNAIRADAEKLNAEIPRCGKFLIVLWTHIEAGSEECILSKYRNAPRCLSMSEIRQTSKAILENSAIMIRSNRITSMLTKSVSVDALLFKVVNNII